MTNRDIQQVKTELADLEAVQIATGTGSLVKIQQWKKAERLMKEIVRYGAMQGTDQSLSVTSVRSALMFLTFLKEEGKEAPHDIYLMPDHNILVEWQMPRDVIRRVEVEGDGCGSEMITFPDREAVFKDINWPTALEANYFVVYPKFSLHVQSHDCEVVSDPEFSLAA